MNRDGVGLAHDRDILIAGTSPEARRYRQFAQSQQVTATMPERLNGRRFRIAWYTPLATASYRWPEMYSRLTRDIRVGWAEALHPVEDWEPAEETFAEKVSNLARYNAWLTLGEYGDGYEQAIVDVLALLVDVQ